MHNNKNIIKGSYSFDDGSFIPDDGMIEITQMLKHMKMLAGSTENNVGEFYFDEDKCKYWHYIQSENYQTTLKLVKRKYIEEKFPNVDCNTLLKIE